MGLFGKRSKESDKPDWSRVDFFLIEDEERLAAIEARLSGQSFGYDGVDQPCTAFVTDVRLLVDVRPQTATPPPRIIEVQHLDFYRFHVVEHPGGVRILFVARPSVTEEIVAVANDEAAEVRVIAVDLPKNKAGRSFARLLAQRVPKSARWDPTA